MAGCAHVAPLRPDVAAALALNRANPPVCSIRGCKAPPTDLWGCLTCGHSGCGQGAGFGMHAFAHAKATMHFVVMNRTTSMIWCYACDSEVLESDVLPDEYNARLGEYRALVLPPQRGSGGGSAQGGGHIVEAAIAARKVVIGTRRESDPRTPLVAKYPVTGGLTGLGNVRSCHFATVDACRRRILRAAACARPRV